MKKYPPSPKKATAQTVASNNIIAYGIFRFHEGMSICRFHELSHYNASIMLALNVPDKYAMERMGYSTPATLKKVYQHTMTGKRAEVNDMINGHMAAAFLSK